MCCNRRMMRSSWLIVLAATACGHIEPLHDAGGSPGDGGGAPEHGASVLELHAGPSRAGAYVDAAFTTAAAASLHVDATFTAKYSGAAFAQALYLDRGGCHGERGVDVRARARRPGVELQYRRAMIGGAISVTRAAATTARRCRERDQPARACHAPITAHTARPEATSR
jgi:hypothetical protein